MANFTNIPSGYKLTTQVPLDVKQHCQNETLLQDLGLNDNLVFTYYKGLIIYCIDEGTRWEWNEVPIGLENTGLLTTDYTYPSQLNPIFGVDYSDKKYNFFEIKFDQVLEDVSGLNPGIVNNTSLQELGGKDKLINTVRIGKGNALETTILGQNSLSNDVGGYNTGIGYNTLNANGTGYGNVAVGGHTLKVNTSGYFNLAIGNYSMSKHISGNRNIGIGAYALQDNTTGFHNIAIGVTSLLSNTSGNYNTVMGSGAMYYGSSSNNTVYGFAAMQNNTTGGNNIAIGWQAGGSISTGTDNVILGYQFNVSAGLTTGSNNIFLGNTLNGITTGSGNVTIGKPTGLTSSSSNTITIADGVGNVAFSKTTIGQIITPNLTNALITSAGAKSLITKEYLDSVNDGSETKVTAGTNVTVTGAGTIASPYVISSVDLSSITAYLPVNRGTVGSLVGTLINPGSGTPGDTYPVSGDITSATITAASGDSTTIRIVLNNAMATTNYVVKMFLQSFSTLITDDNDILSPVFKVINATTFDVNLRQASAFNQAIKLHIEVINL